MKLDCGTPVLKTPQFQQKRQLRNLQTDVLRLKRDLTRYRTKTLRLEKQNADFNLRVVNLERADQERDIKLNVALEELRKCQAELCNVKQLMHSQVAPAVEN